MQNESSPTCVKTDNNTSKEDDSNMTLTESKMITDIVAKTERPCSLDSDSVQPLVALQERSQSSVSGIALSDSLDLSGSPSFDEPNNTMTFDGDAFDYGKNDDDSPIGDRDLSEIAGFSSSNSDDISQIMASFYSETEEKVLTTTSSSLITNSSIKRQYDRRYQCNVCHKRFKQKCHLTSHSFIHTGEKPFSCKICGKRFTQRSNLKTHEAIHGGGNRLPCEICKKTFPYKAALRQHILHVHSMRTSEEQQHLDMIL